MSDRDSDPWVEGVDDPRAHNVQALIDSVSQVTLELTDSAEDSVTVCLNAAAKIACEAGMSADDFLATLSKYSKFMPRLFERLSEQGKDPGPEVH